MDSRRSCSYHDYDKLSDYDIAILRSPEGMQELNLQERREFQGLLLAIVEQTCYYLPKNVFHIIAYHECHSLVPSASP